MITDFFTDPRRNCAPNKISTDQAALFVSDIPSDQHKAVRICRGCPVRRACDAYATEKREKYGVWGGRRRGPKTVIRERKQRTVEQEAPTPLTAEEAGVGPRKLYRSHEARQLLGGISVSTFRRLTRTRALEAVKQGAFVYVSQQAIDTYIARQPRRRRNRGPLMCAHVWPDELEPDTRCLHCGLPYAEWSEEDNSD